MQRFNGWFWSGTKRSGLLSDHYDSVAHDIVNLVLASSYKCIRHTTIAIVFSPIQVTPKSRMSRNTDPVLVRKIVKIIDSTQLLHC